MKYHQYQVLKKILILLPHPTMSSRLNGAIGVGRNFNLVPAPLRESCCLVFAMSFFEGGRYRSSSISTHVTPKSPSKALSESEQRQMEEALASIRLRARHNDPYEDWERNVRRESFVRIQAFSQKGLAQL